MNTFGRLILILLFGLLASQAQAQYYGSPGQRFTCRSEGYRQNYCEADTRYGVSMVRQVSDSACVEGRTWGYDQRGVWVTEGCAAEFVLGSDPNVGYGDRYGSRTIRCESSDYRQQYCRTDTRGGVRLSRQLSDSACIQGRSWDYDRDGVWVSNGCKADFTVGVWEDRGPVRTVRCESIGSRTNWCRMDTRGGVRLTRRLSNAACYQGRSWDWDRSGIWVSNGCRAEFQVGGMGRWREHDDDRGWDDRR
jgi:hypothetical protein